MPWAKDWRFPSFARKEAAGRARRKKRPLPKEGTLFGTVFVYLGRRTMSGVISAREWAPHMAMVSVSSARSFST